MTPRTRFIVWVVLFALIVIVHGGWIGLLAAGPSDSVALVLVGGSALLALLLLGMLWLLASTPANAIKLKPAVSVAIIVGIAALVQAAAVIFWGAPEQLAGATLAHALKLIAPPAAALAAAALLLPLLRRQQRSPWWAAVFAWHPLVVLEAGGLGHVGAVGALIVVAALLVAARVSGAPRPLIAVAAVAGAAALAGILLVSRGESALTPLLCLLPLAALARPAWSAGAIGLSGVAPVLYILDADGPAPAWHSHAVYAACLALLMLAAWGAWRSPPAQPTQAD